MVGGGHNGLVAAGLLAQRGARVTVLERRATVGGAATTEQPWGPAFKMSALSYVVSLIPPTIVRELELARHGYKIYPQNGYFVPYRDGRSLQLPDDDPRAPARARSRSSRAPTPTRTSAGTRGSAASPTCSARCSRRSRPRVGSRRPRDLVDQARLAWTLRRLGVAGVGDVTRLFTSSIADLLDEWFTSPQMQGVLVGERRDRHVGRSALARHRVRDGAPQDRRRRATAQLGSWGFPEGGMGAVSDALRDAAIANGATVRTDAPVARIDVRNGRVRGVTLESGEELRADVVVAATHPKITFLDQIDRAELPDRLRRPRSSAGRRAAEP